MRATIHYRISLGLNLILAVMVAVLMLHKSDAASVATIARGQPAAEKAKALPDPQKAPQDPGLASEPERRRWLIDQLRSEHVPENVLARFALTDIEESWAGRFEACQGDQNKLATLQLEHDMGLDAEMRGALGATAFRRWDQTNMLREAMLGSKMQLTTGEADAIYDLKKKLQQRQWTLDQARQTGRMADTDVSAESNKAFAEFGQGMKAVLGDAKYEQAMRGDDGSSALKANLAKVNASDAQFQQLLAVQQQLSDRRTSLAKEFQDDPSSELYAQRVKTLDAEQTQQYRQVLGDGAFEALQKEQDGSYMKMKQYGSLWGLDDGKIDSVYGAIKYYQKSVEDYQDQAHLLESQGKPVDWNSVDKNLQQFVQQTEQMLQKDLGADRYQKMQQNGVFPFTESSAHRAPVN